MSYQSLDSHENNKTFSFELSVDIECLKCVYSGVLCVMFVLAPDHIRTKHTGYHCVMTCFSLQQLRKYKCSVTVPFVYSCW